MKKSIIALSVLAGLGLTGCENDDIVGAIKDNTVAVKDAALHDTKAKTDHAEFNRIRGDLVAGVSPLDSITKEEWQWLANFVKGQEKNIKLYKDHVADHELEDHTVKILFTDETVLNDDLTAYLTFVNDIYSKAKVHANLTRGLTAKEAGIVSKLEITESTGLTGADVQKFIQLLPKGFEGATNQAKYRKLMNAAIGVLKLDKTVGGSGTVTLNNQALIDELEYKMTMDIGTAEEQVEVLLEDTDINQDLRDFAKTLKTPKDKLEFLESALELGDLYAPDPKKVIDLITEAKAKIAAMDFFVAVEKTKAGDAEKLATAIDETATATEGQTSASIVASIIGSSDTPSEVTALGNAIAGAADATALLTSVAAVEATNRPAILALLLTDNSGGTEAAAAIDAADKTVTNGGLLKDTADKAKDNAVRAALREVEKFFGITTSKVSEDAA